MDFKLEYAFRRTGSTTSALMSIAHQLTEMLATNPYVHLIALDISKAFDSVRHGYIAEQLAEMPIPDNVYNWIIAALYIRQHKTKFKSAISTAVEINVTRSQD